MSTTDENQYQDDYNPEAASDQDWGSANSITDNYDEAGAEPETSGFDFTKNNDDMISDDTESYPSENQADDEDDEDAEPPKTFFQRITSADRYNMVLLMTVLMLCVGIVLMVLRLSEYNFDIKATKGNDTFGQIQICQPMDRWV